MFGRHGAHCTRLHRLLLDVSIVATLFWCIGEIWALTHTSSLTLFVFTLMKMLRDHDTRQQIVCT